MLGRTDRRMRHVTLLALFVCIAVVLGARLTYWQLGEGEQLRQRAAAQLTRPALEFVRRGDITDRRGTLLATTAYRDLLAAYPDLLPADRRASVALRLGELLGFDDQRMASLVETFERGVPYTVVSRRLTSEQSQQVRTALANGELAAITLEPQPLRFYPNPGGAPRSTLASQLLGFVTDDGQGRYGVEQFNHALLAGSGGTMAALGAAGAPAAAGTDISLTIDASLQLRIEKELYAVWVANEAERVSALVMDPRTGAVLAWASVPGYDANAYTRTARDTPEHFLDPIASQIYEPGSVMKMITAAAALEAGVVTPKTTIHDGRGLEFGAYTVRNADRRSMGKLTFAQVLAYSRNVPTAKVAGQLGSDTAEAAAVLYDMWQRLGLGQVSGVEVSSEARGIAADPQLQRWAPVDLANRSFGQGVAVTPLQLAAAFSTMVNGGYYVPPHVIGAPSGSTQATAPAAQVLDAELSRTLRELMINNVTSVDEVASKTLIEGYTVGGKTGTAQIWDSARGQWAEDEFNYTFCGFVGDDEPDLVIVVTIQKPSLPNVRRRLMVPRIEAYELFQRVALASIAMLDLPPDGASELDQPAPGEELPVDEEPADEQPSDEQPSDDQPSDEQPAATASPTAAPSPSPSPAPVPTLWPRAGGW